MNNNLLHSKMFITYTCVKTKNNKLYVYGMDEQGKKFRVSNIYAARCPKKQIKTCKYDLCKKQRANKKLKYPCRKQKTVFLNKKEVNRHCRTKINGPYDVDDRQRVADEANKLLKSNMKELASKHIEPVVRFDEPALAHTATLMTNKTNSKMAIRRLKKKQKVVDAMNMQEVLKALQSKPQFNHMTQKELKNQFKGIAQLRSALINY